MNPLSPENLARVIWPASNRSIARFVFRSPDGRILGVEFTYTRQWQGRDEGYVISALQTNTAAFRHMDDACDWVDEAFESMQYELARDQVQGHYAINSYWKNVQGRKVLVLESHPTEKQDGSS